MYSKGAWGVIGGRGFPYRRILSLGAMGMGAWPDSRVVRRSSSSSESVDFHQKGKTVSGHETYLEKRLGIVKHVIV